MGLDMYLYRKVNGGEPVIKKYTGPNEEEISYTVPGEPVAYWRKVNQVHGWFVTNVQDGVDDCQTSDVTRDDLVVLYKLSRQALVDRNPELLPTVEGSFFGSANADEWYWHGLVDTCEMLSKELNDSRYTDAEYIYQSSW